LQGQTQSAAVKLNIRLSLIFWLVFCLEGYCQEGIDYDLKKPAKYENRTLGYEKTYETKFKAPRHFIQNTVTHYNYYFNANNKLNAVIGRAKTQFRDDFTKLLPFYNYTLDATAKDRRELDSVIDKANTGILIHDLRNDWVDNLYMLMGKAYYFKKQFDSAYITFQFVNYAFAPREKDGYSKPIGSNSDMEQGGTALTISTKEKSNILKKAFSLPPSRNESLVWMIRTYLAGDQYNQAAVLTEILKQDPQFPGRLQPDLHELQALWFYKQNLYDSAASHLEKALDNATNINEQARWEYLIAQLYERSEKPALAEQYYEKVVSHTFDPVMEVYARLNSIRQNRGSGNGEDYIVKNIHALDKMARREIYIPYRDIIYFSAAEMELERNDKNAAISYLVKTTKNAAPGSQLKNKAFLKLGDLAFEGKNYRSAKTYYDSVNTADLAFLDSANLFLDRKKALDQIVAQLRQIDRQDSLQRIAMMTEEERNAYLKKLLRALHKQQGLSEEDQEYFQSTSFNSNSAPADLFGAGSDNSEWYFYNNSLKSRGYSDFKSKWGNRPNVDNWQVASMVSRQRVNVAKAEAGQGVAADNAAVARAAVSFESLLANVPMTPDKMKKSMDTVENALFKLGKSYQDGLPDYHSAINAYDSLLAKFPGTRFREETLFNLYYCYKKVGDEAAAANVLQLLRQQYPSGRFTALLTTPADIKSPEHIAREDATRRYDSVYASFIEGRFEDALTAKKNLDSVYGEKYWTPQLQYIEAMYYMHIRMDSVALEDFGRVIKKYPGTPIADRAKTAMDVLKDRKRMEEYLSNLKIERARDDSFAVVKNNELPKQPATEKPAVPANKNLKPGVDSSRIAKGKVKADTARAIIPAPVFRSAFVYAPEKSHDVVVLLTKVDPVYVTETRNAFNRYNRETYYNKTFDINNLSLDDSTKLVVISGFDSAGAALEYMNKARTLAPREIIPWLQAGKYSFLILSDQNLEILKSNKDMAGYKKFLSQYFPGKF
jgi:outer membrane protein assembly factor BamD (BamD/ComL family)